MHGPQFFPIHQVTCGVPTLQNGAWRVAVLWRRRGEWEVTLHHRTRRTTHTVVLAVPITIEQMLDLEEELALERQFEQEDGNVVARAVSNRGRLSITHDAGGRAECVLVCDRPLAVSLHGLLPLPLVALHVSRY